MSGQPMNQAAPRRLHLATEADLDQTALTPQPDGLGTLPHRRASEGAAELLGGLVSYGPGRPDPDLAPGGQDLRAHVAHHSVRPACSGLSGDELLDRVREEELTGRGGAAFPVARKWDAFLASAAGGVVVANGAESEPLSAKDAALLQLRPHLVLDGLACAAEAVGAEETVLWLHESALPSRQAVVRALAERRSAGLVEPPVRIALAADHYLSGESSVVVNALSGRPALPSFRRVPATTTGVNGRPTLVHNVETLALIALLARGFSSPKRLVTVAREGRRTVVELSGDERLANALDRVAGSSPGSGPGDAVLLGGYGGQWVTAHDFGLLTPLRAGRLLGAGIIEPLPPGTCGLARTAEIVDQLAAASARQCGPCLFGLPAVAKLVRSLAEGRPSRRDGRRLETFLAEINGRGGCHHPDGAVALIRSALRVFADDVHAHLSKGRCRHA